MNLGGGAVVQGDYRLLSSKLWEEAAAPQAIERLQTTSLSSEYIQ